MLFLSEIEITLTNTKIHLDKCWFLKAVVSTFSLHDIHSLFWKLFIAKLDSSKQFKIYYFIKQIINPWCKCVFEPPRGRVSEELSKPVKRKGAMCVVLV